MKIKFGLPVFGCLLLVLAVAGCSPSETPKILYGKEKCGFCNMIIGEERFSAVIKSGQDLFKFDDIGCAAQWFKKRTDTIDFLVRDYETAEWLKAEEAVFIRSKELMTPMGYGLAASSNLNSAENTAQNLGGKTLTFEQLKNLEEVKR